MAAPLEPPRLAEIVDLAERPRADDWSARAALCRYAQPQPERAAALLSLIRRIESALGADASALRTEGPGLLAEAQRVFADRSESSLDSVPPLVGLVAVAEYLDRCCDDIARWAAEPAGVDRPDALVDEVTARVAADLEALGVADEPAIPRGVRGRG